MDSDLGFGLVAAFVIAFILFLTTVADTPVPTAARSVNHVTRYAQCATASPARYGAALDYEDVWEAEHDLCNVRYFPYCHALPIPWNRQLDETYFDSWNELGCARDLVPDAACYVVMPPHEWHRGAYTYVEDDKGCVEP